MKEGAKPPSATLLSALLSIGRPHRSLGTISQLLSRSQKLPGVYHSVGDFSTSFKK